MSRLHHLMGFLRSLFLQMFALTPPFLQIRGYYRGRKMVHGWNVTAWITLLVQAHGRVTWWQQKEGAQCSNTPQTWQNRKEELSTFICMLLKKMFTGFMRQKTRRTFIFQNVQAIDSTSSGVRGDTAWKPTTVGDSNTSCVNFSMRIKMWTKRLVWANG